VALLTSAADVQCRYDCIGYAVVTGEQGLMQAVCVGNGGECSDGKTTDTTQCRAFTADKHARLT